MISAVALIRQLEHERYRLKLIPKKDAFTMGIIAGLTMSLVIIGNMWTDIQARLKHNRKYMSNLIIQIRKLAA